MKKYNILDELKLRGFIKKINDISDFQFIVKKNKIIIYCGFDPTASSLHIGHLLPLLCLSWFQKYGHKIIILIGYATSLIGDPSFKSKTRILQSSDKLLQWSKSIKNQIYKFFEINNLLKPIILNNFDWFKNVCVIDFFRNIGKFFSVNKMISKKFVQNRIKNIEQGISFTEFSYNLLQSYDFLYLYKKYRVILQIGGSDQWGNISSGINLIRRMYQTKVFGLTIPLLLQSNGMKFGKTEKNQMIWLNKNKTSPYVFHQFWLNIHDNHVINFLKLFTFVKISTIHKINILNKENVFYAKSMLADQITKIVHGKKILCSIQRIRESLFTGKIKDLTESDFVQLKKDGLSFLILSGQEDLKQVLVNAKFTNSRSESHKLIIQSGIKINNRIEINPQYQFNNTDKLFGKFTLLNKGKKKYILLCW